MLKNMISFNRYGITHLKGYVERYDKKASTIKIRCCLNIAPRGADTSCSQIIYSRAGSIVLFLTKILTFISQCLFSDKDARTYLGDLFYPAKQN